MPRHSYYIFGAPQQSVQIFSQVAVHLIQYQVRIFKRPKLSCLHAVDDHRVQAAATCTPAVPDPFTSGFKVRITIEFDCIKDVHCNESCLFKKRKKI